MTRVSLLAAAGCLLSVAAFAQGWNPSTDDLIRQLNPRAGGPGRGVRGPSAAPQADEPVGAYRSAEPRAVVRQPRAARFIPQAAPVMPADPQGTASLTVLFETGSDRLTPQAMHTLDVLGRALSHSDLAQYSFNIVGHTDTVGTPELNRSLSERRAAAVAEYIAGHYPVDRTRLAASGRGQDEPLVPTAPGVNEPRNRRVQVVTVGS